jgi:predicted phosphodiesterase
MKIALIADVHGNALALERIIEDAAAQGAERLVSLGDFIANGPCPAETLALHRQYGIEAIRGNTEDYIINAYRSKLKGETFLALSEKGRKGVQWCCQVLTEEDILYIEKLPATLEINLPCGNKLLCYHGTPSSNMGELKENSPNAEFDKIIRDCGYRYYAGGHTHNMYIKRYKGNMFINPGCAGIPVCSYEQGKAASIFAGTEYIILEVSAKGGFSASIRRIRISKKELKKMVENSEMPNKQERLNLIEKCNCPNQVLTETV